jgi:hypothetical protein
MRSAEALYYVGSMTNILGVSVSRFLLGVIAAEAAPILLLVLAMLFVGLKIGGRPSQETASGWGAWIGPIGGALATFTVAWFLARSSRSPIPLGVALGTAVGCLDLALIATQGVPFRWLFAVSALTRVLGGGVGGVIASRSALLSG